MKKVLVADDEEDVLAVVKATLSGDHRYQLLLAHDGEEALDLAKKEKPELVFLDVMMPKRDGFQVCLDIKKDPVTAQAKVVILTARSQESDRRRAKEMGADDFFTKPFSPTALLKKVTQVLRLR